MTGSNTSHRGNLGKPPTIARPCSCTSTSRNQDRRRFTAASLHIISREICSPLTNVWCLEPSEPQHVPLLHGYKRTKMTCIPTKPWLTRRQDFSRVLPVFSTITATFAASRLFTPPSSRTHHQNSRTASRSLFVSLGVGRRTSQLATPHVIHRGTRPPDIPIVSWKGCFGTRSTC
jgi:hypothetical protein